MSRTVGTASFGLFFEPGGRPRPRAGGLICPGATGAKVAGTSLAGASGAGEAVSGSPSKAPPGANGDEGDDTAAGAGAGTGAVTKGLPASAAKSGGTGSPRIVSVRVDGAAGAVTTRAGGDRGLPPAAAMRSIS